MPDNPNIHHRRSICLKDYDYSQAGLYFITICVQNRHCLFGKIADNKMVLNEYGKIAYDEWLKTPNIRANIQLDEFIVFNRRNVSRRNAPGHATSHELIRCALAPKAQLLS
jgi:hypothetical protein